MDETNMATMRQEMAHQMSRIMFCALQRAADCTLQNPSDESPCNMLALIKDCGALAGDLLAMLED